MNLILQAGFWFRKLAKTTTHHETIRTNYCCLHSAIIRRKFLFSSANVTVNRDNATLGEIFRDVEVNQTSGFSIM